MSDQSIYREGLADVADVSQLAGASLSQRAQRQVDYLLATTLRKIGLEVPETEATAAAEAIERALANRRPATEGWTVSQMTTSRSAAIKVRFTIRVA